MFQTCHILHKKGRYYIVHFLELFQLDGRETHFSQEDRERRNLIASLLEQWKLVEIVNPDLIKDKADISAIKIIPFADKSKYILTPKYSIGKNKY